LTKKKNTFFFQKTSWPLTVSYFSHQIKKRTAGHYVVMQIAELFEWRFETHKQTQVDSHTQTRAHTQAQGCDVTFPRNNKKDQSTETTEIYEH